MRILDGIVVGMKPLGDHRGGSVIDAWLAQLGTSICQRCKQVPEVVRKLEL